MKKVILLFSITLLITCVSIPKRMDLLSITPEVNPRAKSVADLTFRIGPGEEKTFYYKFADMDTIIFNAYAIEGKDISDLSIVRWPETHVFASQMTPVIENKKMLVDKKSIYSFRFKNSSWVSSNTYRFIIHRVPSEEKYVNFNTAVEFVTFYDTTYVPVVESMIVRMDTIHEEFANMQIKIGSQLSGPYRTFRELSIPSGTSYWVYWTGVGQEGARSLQEMASQIPQAALAIGVTDPLTAFALGFLPYLIRVNQGLDINYYFITDNENLNNFINEASFYPLRRARGIITDYAKMESPTEGVLYLGIDNSHSTMTSKTVMFKAVAIKIVPQYMVREVKKPIIKMRVLPKIEK